MNWDAIGAIGEIFGALAVFISLLYLASQIRSNTAQSKATMAQGIMRDFGSMHETIISNLPFAELMAKASKTGELTEGEEQQLNSLANKMLSLYVTTLTAYENHQISKDFYETIKQDVIRLTRDYRPVAERVGMALIYYPDLAKKEIFEPLIALSETKNTAKGSAAGT